MSGKSQACMTNPIWSKDPIKNIGFVRFKNLSCLITWIVSCFDCISLYNLCIHNMIYPAMHQVCLCKHWGNRVTRSAATTLGQGSTKQSGGSRCRKGWRLRWVSNKLVSATPPLEWCNMFRRNWINLWNVIVVHKIEWFK